MPVHNAGPFLGEALDSALSDLPGDAELVVVDDGSSDGSWEHAQRVAEADARVVVLRHDVAQGVSAALNAGAFWGVTPTYFAVAEHDDVVLKGRFSAQVTFIDAHPEIAVVGSEGRYLGPTGVTLGRVSVGPRTQQHFDAMKSRGEPILVPHPSAMFRFSAFAATGGYSSEFDGAQDLELMNRLIYAHGWEARTLEGPHMLYRVHAGATSFSRLADQRMMTRYVRYRNACLISQGDALPYADWKASNRATKRDMIRWWRHDRGALLYRRAGLEWIQGRRLRGLLLAATAAVFHPNWVVGKALVQAKRR